FGAVASDSPWLRVLTPQVGGPQQATIVFEVDSKAASGATLQGKLRITANGGKVLRASVFAEIRGAPRRRDGAAARGAVDTPTLPVAGVPAADVAGDAPLTGSGLLRSVFAFALAFFLLRLLLVPLADWDGRTSA